MRGSGPLPLLVVALLGSIASGCFDVTTNLDRFGSGSMTISYPAPSAPRLEAQRQRFVSAVTSVKDIKVDQGRVKIALEFTDVTRLNEAPAFSHLAIVRHGAGAGQEALAITTINQKPRPQIKASHPGIVTLVLPGKVLQTNGERVASQKVRWEIPIADYLGKPEVKLEVTFAAAPGRAAHQATSEGKGLPEEVSTPVPGGGSAADYLEVVRGLLDRAPPQRTTSPLGSAVPYASVPRVTLPSVEVAAERRYVTSAVQDFELVPTLNNQVRVPAGGDLQVSYMLPPELRSANAVLVVGSVKPAAGEWKEALREVVKPATDGSVKAKIPLASAAGQEVKLSLLARALSSSATWRSPPVSLPASAHLEFGFAIEEVGWHPPAPPVTFRVRAMQAGQARPRLLLEERLDPAHRSADRRWKDKHLDLAWAAGKTVTFLFETDLESKKPASTYPLWSNPTVFARSRRPENTPNIILISIDTLRAQELSCYGYHFPTSPFLDELSRAKASVLFEKAFSTSAATPQAHMSMFTSLEPSLHGITTGLETLPSRLITVSELLRQHGYETGAVTEDGWLAGEHGFARGINTYKENKSSDLMKPSGQIDETVTDALAWLKRNAQKKVFLFVHTFQVHAPYAPPKEYANLFEPFLRDGRKYIDPQQMPAYLRDQLSYDREIRYTDDQLRRFFHGLSELGLDKQTVVFITADHGEEFLEHGYLQHGAHLYEEVVRVPLIVWGPGVVNNGPRRVGIPVSILDLMPTMLELAGIPMLSNLRGVSLRSTLMGATQPPAHRRLIMEAWSPSALSDHGLIPGWKPPAFAVRTDRYKYIMTDLSKPGGPTFELYDLDADATETKNLAASGNDPFPDGRRILSSYRGDATVTRAKLLAGVQIGPKAPQIPLGPEREEKLRALGYIE